MLSKTSLFITALIATLAAATPRGGPPPPVTPRPPPNAARPSYLPPQRLPSRWGLSSASTSSPSIRPCPSHCGATTVVCDPPPVEWGGGLNVDFSMRPNGDQPPPA
ncbi:hypothetical protein DFH08DRAFT_814490 [Mycena albidolilacea]|uniref:Uncharacterized protein n=1 Tax=Mycena albidolilacea TaxID=1033008 RepID=A0AAD6ZQT6_9AGAR|nr:hypothetical protein DFH08DRAFT_814490 [Mycena albidolilacea]